MVITMALLVILILLALLVVFVKRGKRTNPTRTDEKKQADELITVVLPTIKNDR